MSRPVRLVRETGSTAGARRVAVAAAIAGIALLGAICASMTIGSRAVPLAVVWEVLTGVGGDDGGVVWDLRVPRTLLGLIAGVALGVAGTLIQGLTRNRLADPGLLGVNAGAALVVALGAVLAGTSSSSWALVFGFAGALVASAVVLVLAGDGVRADPSRVLLAGVAVSGVLAGITSGLVLIFPAAFDRMRAWSVGSIFAVGANLGLIAAAAALVAVGVVVALVLGPALDAMSLGSDVAVGLGVRETRAQLVGILALALLVGGVTSLAGPIAFIGLMVPRLVALLGPSAHRMRLLAALVVGPVVLLSADVLGRLLLPGGDVPVGVSAALLGAPVLLVIAQRARSLR